MVLLILVEKKVLFELGKLLFAKSSPLMHTLALWPLISREAAHGDHDDDDDDDNEYEDVNDWQ